MQRQPKFAQSATEGANHVVQYRNLEWFDNKFSLYVARYTLLNPLAFKNEISDSGRGWTVHFYYTGLENDFNFTMYGPSFLGIQIQREEMNVADCKGSRVVVNIPYWCILVLSSILPAVWIYRRLRASRRARAGYCVNCGYDLRATPDRCPECGAEAHAS